jgi:hypothetical protein
MPLLCNFVFDVFIQNHSELETTDDISRRTLASSPIQLSRSNNLQEIIYPLCIHQYNEFTSYKNHSTLVNHCLFNTYFSLQVTLAKLYLRTWHQVRQVESALKNGLTVNDKL